MSLSNFGDIRFLLVEDQSFIRGLLVSALQRMGAHDIHGSANGKDAIRVAAQTGGRIDCIISDWHMGPINGLQLLQMVRAGEITHLRPDVCFILLTGHADADTVNLAMSLDANAYLVKPVSWDKLGQAIRQGLAKEWKLKGPKHYLAVPGRETLDKQIDAERAQPWVLWTKKPKRKAEVGEKLNSVAESVSGLRKATEGEVRQIRNVRQLPIGEIVAGSILARDVHGDEGQLLIGAGTVLDQNILDRLKELSVTDDKAVKLWIGQFD